MNTNLYVNNKFSGITLKPNKEVNIEEAHKNLIAIMYNFEFGEELEDGIEYGIKELLNAGYTKIISDEKGWTDLI